MSDDEGCGCVLFGLAAAVLGFVLWVGPCSSEKKEEPPEQEQTIENVVKKEQMPEKKYEKCTIVTKIVDVQQNTVPYNISGGQREAAHYKYIQAQGGDVQDAVFIVPHTAQFLKKYVPVKITYNKLEKGEISLNEIVRRYYDAKADTRAETIKADGIVEKGGLEYIKEK